MSKNQLDIEGLLETMGDNQIIGEPEHRYGLRRTLMCSRFFNTDCDNSSRWSQTFSFAIPLFVGGVLISVFIVINVATSTVGVGGNSDLVSGGVENVETFELNDVNVVSVNDNEFISHPNGTLVNLAEFKFEEDDIVSGSNAVFAEGVLVK